MNQDTTTVQALLTAGAMVDHARFDGLTASMCCASEGTTAVLQALLQAGANRLRSHRHASELMGH